MMDYRNKQQAFKYTGLKERGSCHASDVFFVLNHHILISAVLFQSILPLLEACSSTSQARNHHANFDRLAGPNAKANGECFQSS